MGSSGKTITIGYWYRMGAHLALAHPVHAFTRIKLGDKMGWVGPPGGITTTQNVHIQQPDLYGGPEREGGFLGPVTMVMGGGAELPNDYLASVLPDAASGMPAFRHVSSLILRKPFVAANNPNIRPINVEVFFQPAAGWYPETEQPGNDMSVNPAHMIRECLTNDAWGIGYSPLDIDDVSFRTAAQQLYTEGFGLNLVWDTESSLFDFISSILMHVDGMLYLDPFTGVFKLRLLRFDYDVTKILSFDPSNIVSLDSYDRASVGELANQVSLIWYDNYYDIQRSVTVHNNVIRELQGGVVSAYVEMPGVSNVHLASTIAARELKRVSTAFSRIVFQPGRTGGMVAIGDVIKLTWPEYGLTDVVYRVGSISQDPNDSTKITIKAVEDIFAYGQSVYGPVADSLWADPISPPLPAPRHQATEAPYIMIERALNENLVAIGTLDPMSGFVTYQASKPTPDTFSYALWDCAVGGTYTQKYMGALFTPSAVLLESLVPEVTSTFGINPDVNLSDIPLNKYILVGGEIMSVTAMTETHLTVNRGILDTVPARHSMGEIVWFADGRQAQDVTEWADGVTVQCKALTLTGKGPLSLDAAPADNITIRRRWYRPYAPGNFKLNGEYWPYHLIIGEPVLTWSHRDRTTQLSYYVNQTETDIGPEIGVTYTARVYDHTGVVVRTVTGITGTTWTYTSVMESTDMPGDVYMITISAVRDGLESWQPQQVNVYRTGIGYGYDYGHHYGGIDVFAPLPDVFAPTSPSSITAIALSDTEVNLSWTASTDNVAVTGYNIFQDGIQIDTSITNHYSVTGLTANTTYTFTVSAYDAAMNVSGLSAAAPVTTPLAPVIHYVATGGSDVAAGTIGAPFLTLAHAVSISGPGDTIYMRGGTYPLASAINFVVSGVLGNTVKVWAYPGELPILDGTTQVTGANGLTLTNVNYIHIKGIEIHDCAEVGILVSGTSSFNIIEACDVHHTGALGTKGTDGTGIGVYGATVGNQIVNCDAHHNHSTVPASSCGITVSSTGTGNTVSGCRSWLNSGDGFNTFDLQDNLSAQPVTFDTSWAWGNGFDVDGTTVLSPGCGFRLGGRNAGTTGLSGGHLVMNCLAFENNYAGFYESNANVINELYNNTGYNNTNNFAFWGTYVSGTARHILQNNLSFGTLGHVSGVDDTFNSWNLAVTVSSGDFVSVSSTTAKGARNSDGTLPTTTFLNLVLGSDLIDVGTPVGGMPYAGAAPDLGYFQYGL